MNLHEYQSKQIFLESGIPVLDGGVAVSPDEAFEVAKNLSTNIWVVKAQVHAGGRGKVGGVKITKNIDEVKDLAEKMLGTRLVTKQTDVKGLPINHVYIEAGTEIVAEYYFSLVIDRAKETYTFIVSSEGGMDIEAVADDTPEKIIRYSIDPSKGLSNESLRSLAKKLNFMSHLEDEFIDFAKKIYELAKKTDANLIEVNPLIIDGDNHLMALDSKIAIEDNALFRQPELYELRDPEQEDKLEEKASNNDLSYVSLDGNIACMVNGAGLAMATMDLIQIHGGRPANFLDVGGGATTERVTAAFEIILENPNVKAILVNIFGGIVRCDVIADGIINAVRSSNIAIPIIVRLEGTNVENGKLKLEESGLEIISANDLTDAAVKVVESAGV
ncbi:MAG: ADP-forming succinate--CoA ligase subunit beta [Gammaproteobacteria bacterium]|nr:ADP-forming succinate--CoA ligase subunit beta [Gammaproteobacteria bacterium]